MTKEDRIAFITGSHAYGTPTERSDVDLVIRCDKEVSVFLSKSSGVKPGRPIRFGNLNVIAATTDEAYDAWSKGTKMLKNKIGTRPTRKEAVELFKRLGVTGAPSE